VLGLACLTRPSVLFLPVVFLIWLVISRPRHSFIAACLFLVAFVSVQLPWVVRNSRVFGQPVITTTLGGFILYRHNAMIAEDEYFWAYDYDQFKPMVRSVVRRSGYELEELNEAQINALLLEEAKTVIREYRWRYFKLALMRCARVWYLQNSGRGLYAVQNLLVYLGMCVGCLYAVRTRNLMIVAVLLHVGYFVAIHAAINAQYRFICPMMPYVIMVSVWGVAQLCSQERRFGKWIQPASAT